MCCHKMETVHRSQSLPEIKIVAAQLFILLTLVLEAHAVSECTKQNFFIMNETTDATSVCIKNLVASECMRFSTSFNQSQMPEGFSKWEDWPEAPRDLNVVGTNYEEGDSVYPGMSVRFNSSLSEVERRYVTGHLIIWHNKISAYCQLFQLNNGHEPFKNELRNLHDILKTNKPASFSVRVYTLPKDISEEMIDKLRYAEIYITAPKPVKKDQFGDIDTADWTPFVAYQTFDNGSIEVKLTLPPPSMKQTKFDITLARSDHSSADNKVAKLGGVYHRPIFFIDNIGEKALFASKVPYKLEMCPIGHSASQITKVYSEENPQGIVKFNVNMSGAYRIKIWVMDELSQSECNCWRKSGKSRVCRHCGSISTELFFLNVTSSPVSSTVPSEVTIGTERVSQTTAKPEEITQGKTKSTTQSTTKPEKITHSISTTRQTLQSEDSYQSDVVVAGSLIGATFFCVLALLIWCKNKEKVKECLYKNLRTEDNKQKPPQDHLTSESTPIGIVPLIKKIVYIISAEDHEAHTGLVECFVKFLQVHCYCQVITPSNCDTDRMSRFEWFISSVNKADYIVFVDSQGAKSMIMAYLKIIPTRFTPNSFFSDGLKHLLVNQEVRETKLVLVSFQGNHCQTYLHASTVYTLPEHLAEFLQKIHNIGANYSKDYGNWLPMHSENISNLSEGKQLLSAIICAKNYEKNNPDWFSTKYGPRLNSFDSGFSSTLLSSQGLSVSTVDVTVSEATSPVSVSGEPNFPVRMNSPTGISSGPPATPYCFSESQKQATDNVLDNISALTDCTDMNRLQIKTVGAVPDENTSWVTVPHSQFIQEHEREEEDGTEQERNVLFDKMSVVAPESASVMNVDSISIALNNINKNNKESRSECPQQLTSQPGTFCLDFADRELKEEEFQASLIPPDTLSNIKVEESVSRALVNINADNDSYPWREQ